MSKSTGFALAILLLLLAAGLRLWELGTLQPGLSDAEITDVRVIEAIRDGAVVAFFDLDRVGADGGREVLYHTLTATSTTFIGRGLIGYRLPGVLLGLVTLALVYTIGQRLYGTVAGVMALALLAFNLGAIILARTVTAEALLPLLVTAVMLLLIRAFALDRPPGQRKTPPTPTFALLGLVLGLGLYVHPVGLLILLAALIFVAFMFRRFPAQAQPISGDLFFALLIALITAIPFLISALRLPDLNGIGRLFAGFDPTRSAPFSAIIDGLIGIFFRGDTDPTRNLPARPFIDLASGLLLLLGIAATLRNWRSPRFLLPLLMALAVLPVALLQTDSPDFTAFAALLPPLALFFGLGVTTLVRVQRGYLRGGVALGLVALLAFNLIWTASDLFGRWPTNPAMRIAYNSRAGELARHLDETVDTIPTVFCRPTVPPDGQPTTSQLIEAMMHRRQNTTIRYVDCGTALVLTDGGDYQQVILPEPGMLDQIPAYLRDWLMLGQFDPELPRQSVVEMLVAGDLANTIGRFTTTAPVEYAPEAPGGAGLTFPPVRFGGNITFLGYESLETTTYTPGSVVPLVTYWRVEGPLPRDMRLFTHLLSDPVNITAQNDIISLRPADLRPRDVFIQITFVHIPPSLLPGRYTFSVGAYQDSDEMRMVVLVNDQQRGTRLFLPLNRITVER